MYNLIITIAKQFIKLASLFNSKAKLWNDGQTLLLEQIAQKVSKEDTTVWFHAASLGEFEQGRSVIEALKAKHTDYKIVLTFFSPSGYEVRKNYQGADYVFYLPLDTYQNAIRFVEIVNPKFVVFIKYEFWKNYLQILRAKNIPVYLISAIFSSNQLFFKTYGSWYRKVLGYFSHIFVQDAESEKLLKDIEINNVSITGDTRFDRVFEIAQNVKTFPLVEAFAKNSRVFIVGSSWHADEEILFEHLNHSAPKAKYIIAPHEVHASNIERIVKSIEAKVVRYSQAEVNTVAENDVLVIDNIGMLSSLYQYGSIAYIGGGFGVGIHNILEAATFGMPIIFGPNYKRFKEAVELIKLGGAFTINDVYEFTEIFEKLIADENYLKQTGEHSQKFVSDNRGATQKIMAYLQL